MEGMPRHIAIIMDGNGRWAQKRNLPRSVGHKKGADSLRNTVKEASSLSVDILTVFAFSTENWKRPDEEVSFLMNLLSEFIQKELSELHKNDVKIRMMGDLSILSSDLQSKINDAIMLTNKNKGLILNIALNYGGRHEIVRAVKKILNDKKHNIDSESITEEHINNELDTFDLPDPDLLIRTSGEYRVSNFMIWQLAYTEFYFTDTLWPDFDGDELKKAIKHYKVRSRRFGGL
ncbi:isoprenyl transferase [Tindallia californiensis]|uniref:Isoprenyl transferase n=1 Tax=Tindallia californiensis TaxID=159292 RepID=A0A1H3NQW1_9FIRM|nr:isoprenyl transferase [Tindallia californiensis]SDY90835.1 undecaprenyl diphosphate synthase [Tindallia californiensis]